jgi:rod shape-determining protein MreD
VSGLAASDAEPSLARKALTAVVLAAALFAAVIVQLTVVNRLPLPGDAAPDLVLLVVTAIAVCTSPMAGALAGFAGGLALDVAPPAIHYAGEYALVFCLAGWGAARVNRAVRDARGERDPMLTFAVMAGAAAAGEAGKAALGIMLSDPDVTGAVASRVLPTAILYDVLAAPFIFWLVARITRGADAERAPAPEFSVEQRLALVFRSASAGATPGLRLAGTGENYHRPPAAGRAPRLRLSDARAGSRIGAAAPVGAAVPRPGGRARRLSFGGDLPARTGQVRPGSRAPGRNWLRGATGAALAGSPAFKSQAAATARRAARGPGRGWLTAAGQAGLAVPSARQVSRAPGRGWITAGRLARPSARRAAHGPGRGWLNAARPGGGGLAGPGRPRSAADALAARSAPSGLSALSGSGTPMAARGSRGVRAIRASAFRGTRAYHGNWYTAPPSGKWLRRSRHPWRKRLHLPGGRPPVPPGARPMASPSYRARGGPGWTRTPGARPMARGAIASAARRLGLFGGRW